MAQLVTSGYLTLDDLVLADGRVLREVMGGGALYSAAGARVWADQVGIHACTGGDYPGRHLERLRAAGIDLAGLAAGPERSLKLWLLEEDGQRKQQLPKLTSARIEELDAARPPLPGQFAGARGFHVATSLPDTQAAAVRAVKRAVPGAVVTLDIWTESFFPIERYRETGFLAGVDAFLPSDKEVETLWGLRDVRETLRALVRLGPRLVAIKRGADGAVVFDGESGVLWSIPAVAIDPVDTIGAGDAWCGGFLAGLVATGDPLEAGLRGAVSASFAIQGHGAEACLFADPAEAQQRLDRLRPLARREVA
ncbi:MAG: carbohydrate kinase family protein [Chloroflexota bacterium]